MKRLRKLNSECQRRNAKKKLGAPLYSEVYCQSKSLLSYWGPILGINFLLADQKNNCGEIKFNLIYMYIVQYLIACNVGGRKLICA